jgi:phytoene desaturase
LKVVVIGAGLAGLSAACHLVGAGHEVTVLEQGSDAGGRASYLAQDGFILDNGPTVLTMTSLVDQALRAAGSSLAAHLDLVELKPAYRAFYSDGDRFDGDGVLEVHSSKEEMFEEIRSKCSAKDADNYIKFTSYLRKLYEVEFPNFIDAQMDSVVSLLSSPKAAASLLALNAFTSLDKVVRRYFDDDRLVKLFSFQALYAGLSPLEARAIYAIITYMDSVEGVYYPIGGMNQISKALRDAAIDAGVKFEFNFKVESMKYGSGNKTNRKIESVRSSDGTIVRADAVIVTTELARAYDTFLSDLRAPRVLSVGEYSPSAYLHLLGVKGTPDRFAHHNIFFGKQWKKSFDSLLKTGQRMEDPSLLVSLPTATDRSLAPEGHSVLYFLEPIPNLDAPIDWTKERVAAQSDTVRRLMEFGFISNESDIVTEKIYDPIDWLNMGMSKGTPFALSHRFFQSGPFRPKNFSKEVENLFFAGSTTTPGVGVPMVLTSGRLAAERVGAR